MARESLPPAHWGYLATGVDGDATLRRNREAMELYQLRARRLMGVVTPDLKTELLGEQWEMPIYLSAVGHQKMFHPDRELATARASKAQKAMQMLSTVSTTSVEDVAKERGAAPWYQLYIPSSWPETETMLHRVEAAGCKVLVWTIDTTGGRNTETLTRLARTDTRDCTGCHVVNPIGGSSDLLPDGAFADVEQNMHAVTDSISLFLREEVLEDVIGGFAENRVRRDQHRHAAEAVGPHLRAGERRNRGDVAERG